MIRSRNNCNLLQNKLFIRSLLLAVLLLIVTGCSQDSAEDATVAVEPTVTQSGDSSETSDLEADFPEDPNFITIATDAPSRFQDFEDIDQFGNVIGFDPDLMAELAAELGIDYEFVVTGFSGLLDSVATGEFDTAMSALLIPSQPIEGLVFTEPYLEIGQVLIVRANETDLQSYQNIAPGNSIGVQRFSSGEQAARNLLLLEEPGLQLFDLPGQAIQALIDGLVDGVIIDSDDAAHFAGNYPLQLKIAGGSGEEAWLTRKAYGIAVSANRQDLLEPLNEAITNARQDGTIDLLTQEWLVSADTIDAGESLVGTLPDELVIGLVGSLDGLDPAARDPDLIGWEIKSNILSGLYMYDADNELQPVLAEDFPIISEDKLEYTIPLRSGLTFPDGSELTAEDVKFSIDRAAALGNFQVNRYLKDADDNSFADDDSVQVIDPSTIKIVLNEPTAFFTSVLATPPFFIISESCYLSVPDPANSCNGLGPYAVTEWIPGEQLRLEANSLWLGEAPEFENIQIRFYEDTGQMKNSLENGAIDIAWTGLTSRDMLELREDPAYQLWQSSPIFKSYLVIEQAETPWSNARLREAIAFTIDREALAEQVFGGTRQPLFSPVPNDTPGQVNTEPQRDLESSRSILLASGYSPENKLEMTIWFVNDGRYTDLEEQYAQALEAQIEETGLIEVSLEGAPWDVFRPQSLDCNYPAFLLGWPSRGQPARFLDAMSWIEYFITNTDTICSNFESQAMTTLYEEAMAETDEGQRLEIYRQIQELWAREFPTLDLTQESRFAATQPNVQGLNFDAMGLLHYDKLTKSSP
jgi:peptide/nickel transport system substrate-binding protein